jgi:hypothetical protein
VKRRLAALAVSTVLLWLPAVLTPPVAQAAVCSGWSSTIAPPATIRVLRSATKTVQTVDFETYVKTVMPAEWPSSWPMETLRAGAVAIKQYAWYYTMHYRGGTGTGGCYDVSDNTNDQVYKPETYTPAATHIQAVESTWAESIVKNGTFILTGYRSGTDVACGSDADGSHLQQASARHCGLDGKTGEEILHVYFDPGLSIQGMYPPTTFVPLTPARLLDTRSGNGLSGAFTANTPRTFQVRGRGGVPEAAMAVTGNVTVTNPTASFAVYVGAVPLASPATSTVNFGPGAIVSNGLTVGLGAGGTLSATYMALPGNTTDLVFDVTGYFVADTSGATYHAVAPSRLLDTRVGNGLSGPLLANTPATFQVTGRGGIPSNATAVTGNLTVVDSTFSWAIYVGPDPLASPTSSTINFNAGDVKANGLTVALSTTGSLSATYLSFAGNTTDLVFDVTGYYTADTSGDNYIPMAPARLLDTRVANGLSGKLSANVPGTFQVSGRGGVPSSATAVTGNVTVVNSTYAWAVFVGPVATPSPSSSTINFNTGNVIANGLTVALGPGGTLSATYVSIAGNTTDLIFDVTGYFAP